MTESEIEKCRKRLEQFLADLLEPLGRRERRHWSSVYIRGLLLDGERKSIEPMAARLPEGNVQAMQQLIGQSPWPWAPVWQRLAQRMTAELTPDPVWVIDDTGFPKQGHHSVGVARQYSGTLGKTANCQVAVSLHQVGAEESAILDWRLYLPESWTQDGQRRTEAGIPGEVKFQTKWQLGLELIDEARAWGLRCGVVLADGGYGEATEFREGLQARQLPYAVGIPSTVRVDATAPLAENAGARTPADGLPLWRATAVRGAGSSGEGPGVEASALARRYERLAVVPLLRRPRPARARIRRRRPAPPAGLAAGGMAARRERAHEIFSLPPAGELHPATAGACRQKPLEDRTGLSAAQGGTGTGSLRRPPLDGLASSRHPGHVGACVPDLGDVAEQKKLLGGPCHRPAVRSNACCLPGPASVHIVAA